MRLICSRTLILFVMVGESHLSKLSAQSPPCSRNRSPRTASASSDFKCSTSHEVTSGGSFAIWETIRSTSSGQWYSTPCASGLVFQESGAHVVIVLVLARRGRSGRVICPSREGKREGQWGR